LDTARKTESVEGEENLTIKGWKRVLSCAYRALFRNGFKLE